MAGTSWEHASEARAALSAIVSDPAMGVSALSSAQMMSNLLKDLLPDAPREKAILVAAAEAGLADTMREHVAQGMDPTTAVRLAASSFASSTPFTPEACSWVADELAIAIGISEPTAGRGPGTSTAPLAPGHGDPHALPTQIAPAAAGFAAGPAAQPAQLAQAAQSNEQPTVQGYRPPPAQGYQPPPPPGFGQAPGQGYQAAPARGYPQPPGQGYQQGAPGFAQPPQAGGWQQGPQQYGPGAGYAPGGPGAPGVGYGPGGPPRRPGGAKRVLLIVGGAVVGVIVLLIVIGIAVSGGKPKPSPSHHPHSSTPSTPPTSSPAGPPALAAGTTPLRTIMKPTLHAPVGNNCLSRSNTNLQNLNAATVVDAAYCATSFDANVKVWGYQFDSYAHYQTALSNLNSYAGFDDPGTLASTCPPGADPKGKTKWWAISNPNYQTHRPDQVLECFTDHITKVGTRALIIWTLPTQDVIFVGEDTVGNSAADFHYLVDVWWRHVAYA